MTFYISFKYNPDSCCCAFDPYIIQEIDIDPYEYLTFYGLYKKCLVGTPFMGFWPWKNIYFLKSPRITFLAGPVRQSKLGICFFQHHHHTPASWQVFISPASLSLLRVYIYIYGMHAGRESNKQVFSPHLLWSSGSIFKPSGAIASR